MKKIILTGGGTAGHVTPNIALLDSLRESGYEIKYVGSYNGIEKDLIEKEGIPYIGISSGKLRRYIDLKNLSDPFRVIKGYFQAKKIMKTEKPDILFSKGGFVSVPVVLAAKRYHVPVIIHESDMTPGLANKLAIPAASKVCCNFNETKNALPDGKAVVTGCPIRKELLSGSREKALEFTGFSGEKKVLLIIGGSLGSVFVNNAVKESLDELLARFDIVHLCGKGNLDEKLNGREGYVQYEYISEELPDLFALSDIVISRAGANAICELLELKKPNVLIPLSKAASRGDQILNAHSFEAQGYSAVIEEEQLTSKLLVDTVFNVYDDRDKYISNMSNREGSSAVEIIMGLIKELS